MSQSISDEFDPFDDEDINLPAEADVKNLASAFKQWQAKDQEVQRLEAELSAAKRERIRFEEQVIPDIFNEMGVDSIEIEGNKISIKEKMYGSLPNEETSKATAIDYICDLGGEGIIKVGIDLRYDRGSFNEALELYKQLERDGLEPEFGETINHQTLKAWAKERQESGVNVDLNKIGLYNRRFMEVK